VLALPVTIESVVAFGARACGGTGTAAIAGAAIAATADADADADGASAFATGFGAYVVFSSEASLASASLCVGSDVRAKSTKSRVVKEAVSTSNRQAGARRQIAFAVEKWPTGAK
jgi:hypothetical protein